MLFSSLRMRHDLFSLNRKQLLCQAAAYWSIKSPMEGVSEEVHTIILK
jgi:hypothetical protein